MIDDDKAGPLVADLGGDLLDLALAEERGRPIGAERHRSRADNVEVDRSSEADRLLDAGRRIAIALLLVSARDRHKDERTLRPCAWRLFAVLKLVLFGGAAQSAS